MNHLVSLRKHMFLDENISKLLYKNIININNKKTIIDTNNKFNKNTNRNDNYNSAKAIKTDTEPTIFYPFQNDKLFWCFYILVEGINKYNLSRQHYFQTEKEYKIQLITLLRSNKTTIKSYKMKRNEIENELLNEKTITLSTFLLLCKLKNMNIICVNKHVYYELVYDTNIDECKPVIEYNESKGYGIYINKTSEIIKNIKTNKLFIEDINKPLKAITAYKLEDLKEISEKLDITIYNNIGKKKNKKDLYEDIRKKLI